MKSLIIAAMLALAPATVLAADAPTTHIPLQAIQKPDEQKLQATANVCANLLMGKLTVQQVVDGLHLDTVEKQQQLVDTCSLYIQGLEDGVALEQASHQQELPTT